MITVANTPTPEKCHGCEGKGWITVARKPFKCVVCEGAGTKPQAQTTYQPIIGPYVHPPFDYYTTKCGICGKQGCTDVHITWASTFCATKDEGSLSRFVDKEVYN